MSKAKKVFKLSINISKKINLNLSLELEYNKKKEVEKINLYQFILEEAQEKTPINLKDIYYGIKLYLKLVLALFYLIQLLFYFY